MKCFFGAVWFAVLFSLIAPSLCYSQGKTKPNSSQGQNKSVRDRYLAAKQAWMEATKQLSKIREELREQKVTNFTANEEYKKANEEVQATKAEAIALGKEVAKAEPASDTGFDALILLANANTAIEDVMALLFKHHVNRKGIGNSLSSMKNLTGARKFYQTVIEKNTNVSDKTAARYYLGEMLMQSEPATAEKLLDNVVKEGKNSLDPLIKGLATRAEPNLYELKFLSPGKMAPDIVGEDTDGVSFKLSDYRGKVVLLDFWGHW